MQQKATTLSPAWRRVMLISSIGFTLALLIMWPTVLDLGQLWIDGHAGAYQYAWLVLPMFFYLVGWHHRDRILAMTPEPGYAGLPLALLALVLWLAAFVNDFNLGQQLALVLVLQAIALSALGRETFRQLLPIMLLLFFMIPCGDIVQPLLRDLTLKWMEWFAVIGRPAPLYQRLLHHYWRSSIPCSWGLLRPRFFYPRRLPWIQLWPALVSHR